MNGSAELYIVCPEGNGQVIKCSKCKNVLVSTKDSFMVGVLIKEDGKDHRYFMGNDPVLTCCGEERPTIKIFSSYGAAEIEVKRVSEHLNTTHTTEGLRLHSLRFLLPERN